MTAHPSDAQQGTSSPKHGPAGCGLGVETRRTVRGLRESLARGDIRAAFQQALELGSVMGDTRYEGLRAGFDTLFRDAVERSPWGMDHGVTLLADLYGWIEDGRVPAAEAWITAASAECEPLLHLGPRPVAVVAAVGPDCPHRFAADLATGHHAEAESTVRRWTREHGPESALRALLLPVLSRGLFSMGHGAIFVARAIDGARRCGFMAEDLMASATIAVSWATNETATPAHAATRAALDRIDGLTAGSLSLDASARAAYEARVLLGEYEALDATVDALRRGVSPRDLLRACGHAAAVRLGRFDPRWEARNDSDVTVLDVTHPVTYAEAALSLTAGAEEAYAPGFAVLCAGYVGSRAAYDLADAPSVAPRNGELLTAVQARDVILARSIAAGLDVPARHAAWHAIAPFVAFDSAVRSVYYIHAIATTEALRRLEASDPLADGTYLDAALAHVVPRRPERFVRRTAHLGRMGSVASEPGGPTRRG